MNSRKWAAIIPCAGYGTRMGLLPHQSKEMLLDSQGKPLIDYWLDLCIQHDITPIIVTRPEKQDLITHLDNKNIKYITITPSGEWPATVLAASEHFSDKNFLFLPDTRFGGKNIIEDMKKSIDLGAKSCLAIHHVEDVSKWGAVKDYSVVEKPPTPSPDWAWGMMAFTRDEGEYLFYFLQKQNECVRLESSSFVYLDSFKDVTRNGIIEI